MPRTNTEPLELIEFFGVDPEIGALLRSPKTWDEVRECVRVAFDLPSPKERRRAKAQEERKHRGRPPSTSTRGISARRDGASSSSRTSMMRSFRRRSPGARDFSA